MTTITDLIWKWEKELLAGSECDHMLAEHIKELRFYYKIENGVNIT